MGDKTVNQAHLSPQLSPHVTSGENDLLDTAEASALRHRQKRAPNSGLIESKMSSVWFTLESVALLWSGLGFGFQGFCPSISFLYRGFSTLFFRFVLTITCSVLNEIKENY